MDSLALIAEIELETPLRLIGLAAVAAMLWFGWRSKSGLATWRRVGSTACQIAAFTLLVLAFAGPEWKYESGQQMVVFVADASRSIGGPPHPQATSFIEAALVVAGEHRAKFLAFAEQPTAVGDSPPDGAAGVAGGAALTGLNSDAAAAIRLAAASIDEGFVGKIVLLSDGLVPRDDVLNAATGAGLPILTVPLPAFPAPEVGLRQVHAPAEAARGENLALQAAIAANHAVRGEIEVFSGGRSLAKQPVELVEGEQRVSIEVPFGGEDLAEFEVRLSAGSDTISENNVRRVAVLAKPAARIGLVTAQPFGAEAFANMLSTRHFDVSPMTPGELSDEVLSDRDLLILADVPTQDLPAAATDAIRHFVQDRGGGLIVTGGEPTFAEAAYRDSPLETLLPVKAIEPQPVEQSVLALVLVIDKSSSMLEQDRMKLAKIAARQSVQVLEPHDKIGIIAFSNDTQWIAEIAPFSEQKDLLPRIEALEPFGQTHMYAAVERAFIALEQTAADRRHMIILTDGVPSPGDYSRLARQIAAAGIKITTVTLSKDAEQEVMADMAEIAKGVHLHCEDPNDLPRMLTKETRDVAAADAPAEFAAFPLRSLPGLEVQSAPSLARYAPTSPKPGSELLLIAAGRDPLLAWWRQGNGVAMAFTAEATGESTRRWQNWPGYPVFWSRLARQVARLPDPSPLELQVVREPGRFRVVIDAVEFVSTDNAAPATKQFINGATAMLAATFPDGSTPAFVGEQIAPGRYEFHIPAEQPGGYFFGVTIAKKNEPIESAPTAVAMPYVDFADELDLQPTNRDLLREIAETSGGQFEPSPGEVFAPDPRTAPRRYPLGPALILAALLLFVADTAVRRLR